jgi:alpha-glucoside transport system permease protein
LVATLADRVAWGNIAKSLIFMPMAISFVGASVIWKFVYDYRGPDAPQIGIVNAIVVALGGEPQAWITVPFWNNFLLMIILVWIQTGYAMVILSAAIRSVPDEFIEAARVDGATNSQIFWRIVLPQIATTIGVVVTTTIVLVMKVYDIVKVVSNGNFGTQVLANDMFQQAFLNNNIGRGAALAILILISVVPVMYVNIRRMQRES